MGCRIGRNDTGLTYLGRYRPASFDEHGRDHTTNRRRDYDGALSGILARVGSHGDDSREWYP